MKKILITGLLFCIPAVTFFSGCASAPSDKDASRYWPSPPEEPRIAYVRSYRSQDFEKKGFLDLLLGTSAGAGFRNPYGINVAGDRILIALSGSGEVAVMDTKMETLSYMGNKGQGTLGLPIGIAVASDGTVYVTDAKQKKIFGYDGQGELRVAIGKEGELSNPAGIAVNNEAGRLYIADSKAHVVKVYSLKGEPLFDFGQKGLQDGQFNFPTNVAVDKRNGNVVVVDTQNFRVQVFDKDGKFIRKFGEPGDRPGFFARPKGVGIDSEGHIYVIDANFSNFQVFDDQGALLLFVGSRGIRAGQFSGPTGMYIDETDRIYVVDTGNSRVQVFQYLSEKWRREHPEDYKNLLLKDQPDDQAPKGAEDTKGPGR